MSAQEVVINYETEDEVVELTTTISSTDNDNETIDELTWLIEEDLSGAVEITGIEVDGQAEDARGVSWVDWINA
tara:strand:+ start:778 stop:999 length:222 start_codon:yes stop_codon:yes gene_type:complete